MRRNAWLFIAVAASATILAVVWAEAKPPQEPSLQDVYGVLKQKKFVDLTHSFEPGIPHWPGFPDEKRETLYYYDEGVGSAGSGFFAHATPWSASGARTSIRRPISPGACAPWTRST